MYQLSSENFETLLTYKDFYRCDSDVPKYLEKLSKLNVHKAISIVSELIAFRNKTIDFRIFNRLLSIPLEGSLKINLLDLNVHNYSKDPRMNRHKHIISLQMLLVFLKQLIIHGNHETLNDSSYTIAYHY